jgi:hypothetical protein
MDFALLTILPDNIKPKKEIKGEIYASKLTPEVKIKI